VDGEWEEIVALARRLDRGVASHEGIDVEGVLRLARAVQSFHRRMSGKWLVAPESGPASDRRDD
jgi:hypothetical protein